ncbi:MAG: hypothetical protein JNJ77_06030 [Planctomycetia bacterium]|nr:hypothetical protein [Planctomycetia bacterium]
MTHAEALRDLIVRFSGNSVRTVQPPLESGVDIADAIARWLSANVAWYVHHQCRFEPNTALASSNPQHGNFVSPCITVQRRWARDGAEECRITLAGMKNRKLVTHRCNVIVNAITSTNADLQLRLDDTTTNNTLEVLGKKRTVGNRLQIDEPHEPMQYIIPRQRESQPAARQQLPACCHRTLAEIAQIQSIMRTLRGVMVFERILAVRNPTDYETGLMFVDIVNGQITDGGFNDTAQALRAIPQIERNRINQIATLHALEHSNNRELYRLWQRLVR